MALMRKSNVSRKLPFPLVHSFENAMIAKKKGLLEEWVYGYLLREGNHGLATALKTEAPILLDLIEIPLSLLNRIEGPEPLEDRETLDTWEERVSGLSLMIEDEYIPPPLIITDYWHPMEIVDGNHRHEALLRNGVEKHWVIIFIKNDSTKQLLAQYIEERT